MGICTHAPMHMAPGEVGLSKAEGSATLYDIGSFQLTIGHTGVYAHTAAMGARSVLARGHRRSFMQPNGRRAEPDDSKASARSGTKPSTLAASSGPHAAASAASVCAATCTVHAEEAPKIAASAPQRSQSVVLSDELAPLLRLKPHKDSIFPLTDSVRVVDALVAGLGLAGSCACLDLLGLVWASLFKNGSGKLCGVFLLRCGSLGGAGRRRLTTVNRGGRGACKWEVRCRGPNCPGPPVRRARWPTNDG